MTPTTQLSQAAIEHGTSLLGWLAHTLELEGETPPSFRDKVVQAFARFERDTEKRVRESLAGEAQDAVERVDREYVAWRDFTGGTILADRQRTKFAETAYGAWPAIRAAIAAVPAQDAGEANVERVVEAQSVVISEMADALDLADRLIDKGLGMDQPRQWSIALKCVTKARAALTTLERTTVRNG